MATLRDRRRCRERLQQISESTLDRDALRLEAIGELQRVIGFDRWCWPAADPDTLVPLGGLAAHDYGPSVPRVLELEYSGDDFAAMDVVACRSSPAGSLSCETGGDLARSPRWDEVLRPVGIGDEAIVACRDAFGCWGWIKAYRDGGDQPFSDADLELLASATPYFGSMLRRRLAEPPNGDPGTPLAPGMIVLDRHLRAVAWTAEARAWIDMLPAATLFASWGMLPAEVYPVATRSRSSEAAQRARALDRTVDGRWLAIQAAPLEPDDDKIAITLRGATPTETFDLLCRAYALSRRERDVVAALLAGLDTRGVAKQLVISLHTVQDHLKSIFEKTDLHSRRELVAMLSASPDGPRLG